MHLLSGRVNVSPSFQTKHKNELGRHRTHSWMKWFKEKGEAKTCPEARPDFQRTLLAFGKSLFLEES